MSWDIDFTMRSFDEPEQKFVPAFKPAKYDIRSVKQRMCMRRLRKERCAAGLNNLGQKFGRNHPEKVPFKARLKGKK